MRSLRIIRSLDSDKAAFTQWHKFILSFVKAVFYVLGVSLGVRIQQGTEQVTIFALVVFMRHPAMTSLKSRRLLLKKPHSWDLNPDFSATNSEETKLPCY